MSMDEKRKGEIAYAALQADIRKRISLKDVSKTKSKRALGNKIREPELAAINITIEEAVEFTNTILREVFEAQMGKGL